MKKAIIILLLSTSSLLAKPRGNVVTYLPAPPPKPGPNTPIYFPRVPVVAPIYGPVPLNRP